MTISLERPETSTRTTPTPADLTVTDAAVLPVVTDPARGPVRRVENRTSPGTADSIRESYLVEVGKLTVAVGRVETMTATIAANLLVDAAVSPSLVSTLDALETAASESMPPWSAVKGDEVAAWAASTRRLVEEAHALRTAIAGYRFRGTLGDVPRIASPDGSVVPADEHYLQHLTRRLRRNEVFGHALESRLEHIDPTGRSWAWARWQLESRDPERTAEFAWLADSVEGLPREWREWLAR